MTELDKLEVLLVAEGIDYRRLDKPKVMPWDMDRHQIIVVDDQGKRIWDAICQEGSYGYDYGLLEVMGKPVVLESDMDDVCGWLTATDVMDRYRRYLNGK